MSNFIIFAFHHSRLRGEKPGLSTPKNAPPYTDNLYEWGEKFGIFVGEKSWLWQKSKVPRKVLGESFYVKYDFDERRFDHEDESKV